MPLHPNGAGECTEAQTDCRNALHGDDPKAGTPEADQQVVDLVSFYSRNLAVPAGGFLITGGDGDLLQVDAERTAVPLPRTAADGRRWDNHCVSAYITLKG